LASALTFCLFESWAKSLDLRWESPLSSKDEQDFDRLAAAWRDFQAAIDESSIAARLAFFKHYPSANAMRKPAVETKTEHCGKSEEGHVWVTSNFEAPRCLWCLVEKSAVNTKTEHGEA
jgi:hypothetical protein